jgi:hypothetical protein
LNGRKAQNRLFVLHPFQRRVSGFNLGLLAKRYGIIKVVLSSSKPLFQPIASSSNGSKAFENAAFLAPLGLFGSGGFQTNGGPRRRCELSGIMVVVKACFIL